jgi:hypothetical protein
VSIGPIQELVVPYDAGPLMEKVARRRRLMRSRLLSLGITIVVLVIIYLWQRNQFQGGAAFGVLYAVVLLLSFGWFAVFLIGYLRARQELAGVGSGTAVRIGPPGVQVAGLAASWNEVASLAAVKGGLGQSPLLRLSLADGRQASVPFEQLPTFPATLDSTARAFSGGRFGVDLSALDN